MQKRDVASWLETARGFAAFLTMSILTKETTLSPAFKMVSSREQGEAVTIAKSWSSKSLQSDEDSYGAGLYWITLCAALQGGGEPLLRKRLVELT